MAHGMRRTAGAISFVCSAWTSVAGAQVASSEARSLTSVSALAGPVSATGGTAWVAGAELGADRQVAARLAWRGQLTTWLSTTSPDLSFCRDPTPCRRTTPRFSFMALTGAEVGARREPHVTPIAGALVGLHRTAFLTTSFTPLGFREAGTPARTGVGYGAYAGVRSRRFRATIGYTRLTTSSALLSLTLGVEWINKAPPALEVPAVGLHAVPDPCTGGICAQAVAMPGPRDPYRKGTIASCRPLAVKSETCR